MLLDHPSTQLVIDLERFTLPLQLLRVVRKLRRIPFHGWELRQSLRVMCLSWQSSIAAVGHLP